MSTNTELSTGKSLLVIAVVLGCFAVLWPKIFYPMLFGSNSSSSSNRQFEEPYSDRPPHLGHPPHHHPGMRPGDPRMRNPNIEYDENGVPRRTIEKELRPGPVPGMRPAMGGPGLHPQAARQSQQGAMSILMPLYTVGIVIFFVYTIMKLLFKRDDPISGEGSEGSQDGGDTVGNYYDDRQQQQQQQQQQQAAAAAAAAAYAEGYGRAGQFQQQFQHQHHHHQHGHAQHRRHQHQHGQKEPGVSAVPEEEEVEEEVQEENYPQDEETEKKASPSSPEEKISRESNKKSGKKTKADKDAQKASKKAKQERDQEHDDDDSDEESDDDAKDEEIRVLKERLQSTEKMLQLIMNKLDTIQPDEEKKKANKKRRKKSGKTEKTAVVEDNGHEEEEAEEVNKEDDDGQVEQEVES